MKVLLINGSPRKGNTMMALNALKKGLAQMPDAEVEEIICAEKTFVPCKACNACGSMSRCIFADDSPETNAAVEAADAIVFATPVYWWGMSAQMKLLVDKFYATYRGHASHKIDKRAVESLNPIQAVFADALVIVDVPD